MNGFQLNGKSRGCEKPIPGCLGRMVNLFDLTSSMPRDRLLTDKPHYDGSSLSRSRSDVSRMSSISGNEMEDKVMIYEPRRSSSTKKSKGTPVKMLIAQEMSKDLKSGPNPPNVVARLMGLDAPPQQHLDTATQRSHLNCYSRKSRSEIPLGYWQEEHCSSNKQTDTDVLQHQEQNEDKDVYEIWQHSRRRNFVRDKLLQKGRFNENCDEKKKLALIRQKFIEAKRLATDEKLRQTKEFQDALDVLSSNGDLFLKVLQEPNSLFSQHLYGGLSIPPPPETKRITVLKPAKIVADEKFAMPARRNEKQVKEQVHVNQVSLWDNNHGRFSPTLCNWNPNDSPTQPTRIVVLKPNPAKVNDVKAPVVSSTPSSPRILPSENFFVEPKDEEGREARKVAEEITQEMHENLAGHRRDETLLSSVFSNGYTGDESSSDKSENEFAPGNLSDSEVRTPTSRHSWDYINRYGSPFSMSSFSRASCSPESSVCREAKKRLSERWAMMSLNGINREQRDIPRSSSTLGEMLALSDYKPKACEVEDADKDQDPRGSTICSSSNLGARESGDDAPISLSRSKSVPVSSAAYGEGLNVEVPDQVLCKGDNPKDLTKTKASRSSFAGKVSSLFFSKNRKSRKEKPSKSQSNDESQPESETTPGSRVLPTNNDPSEAVLSPTSRLHSETIVLDSNDERLELGICSRQGGSCVSDPNAIAIQGENQDQPSPISVLEPPFLDDDRATLGSSRIIEPNPHGKHMSFCLGKSNLIDKSPPIGSIARTLSWDESCDETATASPLNSPVVSRVPKDDEGEWRFLLQSLLTMAGFVDEGANLARWHSPESPLDPLLRSKYVDLTAREPMHETKRRQLRSTRKLVFDCVNAALLDMTRVGTTPSQWSGPCFGAANNWLTGGGSTVLADKVWAWMKGWLSSEVKWLTNDEGDNDSLVERVVRDEVVGEGWGDQMRLEIDIICLEIQRNLLDELVDESLLELIGT